MSAYAYRLWRDHAFVIASARTRVWSQAQLYTIDDIARHLADMYGEDNPTFDRAWFGDQCKYGRHKIINTIQVGGSSS